MRIGKQEILNFLWERPIEVGHWVGFKDLTDIHNDWLKSFLFSDNDQTLQGHRGSYKTTTLSLFFALNLIAFPNKSVLFFRKTGNDVTEIIRQTSNILHSGCMNEICKSLHGVPISFVRDSNSEISTNLTTKIRGSSQLVGLGLGTSITGKHADIVVTDDIVNVKDRISSAEREHTKIAYQELQNIKNRGGRFINTGTPWHKDDCFTLMPKPIKYDCYSTGLISEQQLADLKANMSPSLFAANYELKHVAADNVIFLDPVMDGDVEMAKGGIAHLDSAFYGEDYTALTIENHVNGKIYMYGKLWRKHVEDCYDDICSLYKEFRCGKIYIERNADKGMVARDLRKWGDVKTVSYDEHMNKHIKIVTYLKAIWKDIVFVEGTDLNYISQICDYTEDAAHDDAPDSAATVARLIFPKVGDMRYIPKGLEGGNL